MPVSEDATTAAGVTAPTARRRRPATAPWRSASVAVGAQLPVILQAYFLDMPMAILAMEVLIVAIAGLLLVLAELATINRWGLSRPGTRRLSR